VLSVHVQNAIIFAKYAKAKIVLNNGRKEKPRLANIYLFKNFDKLILKFIQII